MPGEYHIKTDPDVTPVVHAPRKDWVNSMVPVIKPNKVRICIDPQDLNTAIKREHYPLRTIEEV